MRRIVLNPAASAAAACASAADNPVVIKTIRRK